MSVNVDASIDIGELLLDDYRYDVWGVALTYDEVMQDYIVTRKIWLDCKDMSKAAELYNLMEDHRTTLRVMKAKAEAEAAKTK